MDPNDLEGKSPEEIRELQKQQCIFCQIIAGKIPSKIVYSDDKCVGILDIRPATAGHILLLPREHYAILPQVPADLVGYLGETSQKLSQALIRAINCEGTNIFIANGMAAGQKAPHVMFHLIPRKENDGITLHIPEQELTDDLLTSYKKSVGPLIAQVLRQQFLLGVPPQAPAPTSAPQTNGNQPNTPAQKSVHSASGQKAEQQQPPGTSSKGNLDTLSDFLAGK